MDLIRQAKEVRSYPWNKQKIDAYIQDFEVQEFLSSRRARGPMIDAIEIIEVMRNGLFLITRGMKQAYSPFPEE